MLINANWGVNIPKSFNLPVTWTNLNTTSFYSQLKLTFLKDIVTQMMQLYTLLCSVRPSTADESLTVCRCESRSSRSSTSFFAPLIVEYEVHGASTSLQCTCSFSCSFSCRWTSMSGWKLCFVLLLYLPVCFNSEGNKNKHAMHHTIKCFFFKNIAIFNLLFVKKENLFL